MSFSSILRAERMGRGLTQAELASRANISIPTVRALENGAGTIVTLEAVLPVLGLRWRFAKPGEHRGRLLAERRRARGFSARSSCSKGSAVAKVVTPAAWPEAAATLVDVHEMSERWTCSVIGADRTSVRYRSRRTDEAALHEGLQVLAGIRHRFGYRR